MGNSFKNWDDWGALRTLATGSEWGILSKIGMIGGPLKRSLPVVNGEFFQKLGRLGFLRTLATGSEWGILSRIGMMGSN